MVFPSDVIGANQIVIVVSKSHGFNEPNLQHRLVGFTNNIIGVRCRLARRQTFYLQKYRVFAQNTTLLEMKQSDLREQCLQYWRVPDERRREAPRPAPKERFSMLCQVEDRRGTARTLKKSNRSSCSQLLRFLPNWINGTAT